MGFSQEWENIYKQNLHMSVWPWSQLISLTHRYGNLHKGMKVLELGCGAGANIPFFVKEETDYYAIEGSSTMADQLKKQFKDASVHITHGDFTKEIFFDETFDLVIDRGALTHNTTKDIARTIELVRTVLKPEGKFIGMDWFSTKHDEMTREGSKCIDGFTRVFSSGYFAGLGNVHFSSEEHLHELFANFTFEYLAEKYTEEFIPKRRVIAYWDFVAKKGKSI